MIITTSKEDENLIINLNGDLDASTAIPFDEEIEKAKSAGEKSILVDCAELIYISSAGLGVFMSHLKDFEESDTNLILFNMRENVKKVFEILGLHELLRIVDSKEDAKAILK